MHRRGAFALIELLVVLLIFGLFIGLVSVITRPDDQAVVRIEAERLSQLLRLAASEARLTGRSVAWSAEPSEYRFWRGSGDGDWFEIRDSDLLRTRTLPEGMSLADFRVEGIRSQRAMRLEFVPQGTSLAFSIGLSLGTARYSVVGSPVGDIGIASERDIANDGLASR